MPMPAWYETRQDVTDAPGHGIGNPETFVKRDKTRARREFCSVGEFAERFYLCHLNAFKCAA